MTKTAQKSSSRKSPAAKHKKPLNFPVVGIGASAGGLSAFEAFFSAMPADTYPGMAFIVVQHLAPDYKSILTDLIKRYTSMQVHEAANGITVQPNSVYIIPPNRDMALLNGTLQLLEPVSPRGLRLPIDYFFRSLAQDQHEKAIGIIFSGTGSDGTLGLRAIKGEGGIVMAQTPESTEFDGMPRSAIATGLVDYVLPPAEMPAKLIYCATHTLQPGARLFSTGTSNIDDSLQKVLILLRSQTGHDFSLYKQSTLSRRIERRIFVHQLEHLDDYVRLLQQNPNEVSALFNDLLIGVTNFFRDPTVFTVLADEIIPRLFANRSAGSTIRVWTCGCSTGEEAYSIAILLQEKMEELKLNFKFQIFATDIDYRAIDQARSGIYPASICSDISPERLNRFFTLNPDNNDLRINKGIRDMLIFSKHDVIKDPPFSKIDMISCRNLLIYMSSELQKKLIPLFHYALNPGGILFLGTSESVGDFTDLFSPIDRQAKLYSRIDNVEITRRNDLGRLQLSLPENIHTQRLQSKTNMERKLSPRELTEQLLIRKFTPVSILVNKRGDIIYLHGRSGRYLEIASGDATINNILKTAREGLRYDLTSALHHAVVHNEPVYRQRLKVKTNGSFTDVNLTIEPVSEDQSANPNLYLVVLEDAPAAEVPFETEAAVNATDDSKTALSQISALKRELQAKEEYLQSTIEELETSNEELKSANEEMQSINEELQSTNEELETSKEELQSVNEELSTVNNELQTKVTELSTANNDMNNLLAGTGVGTVFLDLNLCIQRFTPVATNVINLIRSDIGRPIGHTVSNLTNYISMVEDTQEVLDSLIPKEIEVQSKSGLWFLLCIRPYRTLENVIQGAVLTFTEITEIIKARETEQRLAVVVRDSNDAITVQDLEGHILAWNFAAEKMYGWSEKEALAINCRARIPKQLQESAMQEIQSLCSAEQLAMKQTQRLAKDGRIINIWLTATALVNKAGQVYAIATTERELSTTG